MTQSTQDHAPDRERMRRALRLGNRVYQDVDHEMGAWLDIDRDSRVLDAGCGVGGMATVLASRAGALVAIDLDPEHVRETGERIEEAGLSGTASTRVDDITALDDPDGSFDLVWCSRVIHHLPDMLDGVRELARVAKRGGAVAIREGGLGFRVLPDEIGVGGRWFEDRLAAAGVGRFSPPRNAENGRTPYPFGWSQLLIDAGLTDVRGKTFTFDSLSPLTDDEQAWIEFHWRRWLTHDESRAALSDEDAEVIETLLDPDSPHYMFARSDLHLRSATTVYTGIKP
ncbi:MAG: class I SAM-dependent methyltransferase [Chloroflexi bacterium]|nr:class I SAM-dependent methyltransferase [Chloroflexota bacterium]